MLLLWLYLPLLSPPHSVSASPAFLLFISLSGHSVNPRTFALALPFA
jgi:hypothetical protein